MCVSLKALSPEVSRESQVFMKKLRILFSCFQSFLRGSVKLLVETGFIVCSALRDWPYFLSFSMSKRHVAVSSFKVQPTTGGGKLVGLETTTLKR